MGTPEYVYHRIFKTKKHEYANILDVKNFSPKELTDFEETRFYKIKCSDGKQHRSQILLLGESLLELQANVTAHENSSSRWKYIKSNIDSFTEEEEELGEDKASKMTAKKQKIAIINDAKENADKRTLQKKLEKNKINILKDKSPMKEIKDKSDYKELIHQLEEQRSWIEKLQNEKATLAKRKIDFQKNMDNSEAFFDQKGDSKNDNENLRQSINLIQSNSDGGNYNAFPAQTADLKNENENLYKSMNEVKSDSESNDDDDGVAENDLDPSTLKRYAVYVKRNKKHKKIQRIHLGDGVTIKLESWREIITMKNPQKFVKALTIAIWGRYTLVNRYVKETNTAVIQLPGRSPRKVLTPTKKNILDNLPTTIIMKPKNNEDVDE
ncbi:BEN domain-containing protein 5-like [Leptopilina boulardi]|uniref:BEN domain-containing protein 5-like n=1 Tax=Leptopilina boulardi TaxID=63433 RepID=UPI0021F600E2|nr:BEN domain-containing protein 5-like [Leptopilina boulardi]